MKNSRLLSEFCEIDSYLTDSDSDTGITQEIKKSSLDSKELDNSILRMGRCLQAAAKQNLVPGTSDPPNITLRLTRLEPDVDPRLVQTVRQLRNMGIDVELRGRKNSDVPVVGPSVPPDAITFEPTAHINLDLSVLIALMSDLTHAPLPSSVSEADTRFIPSQKYMEWTLGETKKERESIECQGNDTHTKALARQVKQEMDRGLLQEILDRTSAAFNINGTGKLEHIQFWTTQEARDRCLQIVSKIGGPNECRRANALFLSSPVSAEKLESDYWQGSRYPGAIIPLVPIHVFPTREPHKLLEQPLEIRDPADLPPFFTSLARTCRHVLAQGTMPQILTHASCLVKGKGVDQPSSQSIPEEIQPVPVTKSHPRLTAHTIRSMLWGAEMGWTTLTANRSSMKVMIREMKQVGDGRFDRVQGDLTRYHISRAAFWIVDPRSLAEGQRADFTD